MSFLANLFGGGKKAPEPSPVAAAPTISSGAVEAADREAIARLRKRTGAEDTILGGGLGDVGTKAAASNLDRTTLLGGGLPS